MSWMRSQLGGTMITSLTNQPTAKSLAGAIRDGALSPLEAVEQAIERIEERDGPINAVVVRDFDRARETAHSLGKPGDDQPMFGVPMTVKESFDVAGLPTSWGHERFAGRVARRDAEVVRRLKAAGAVILGKTNVPPDLADWQSDNPVYGRTVNPHDPARSPGGSSGGSAAAVASGMVPCEFGTDIGGSIRVPAHFSGIWGHKPSWGLVSKRGHDHPLLAGRDAADGALSVAGPLARSAEDLALLLRITATRPLAETSVPLRQARMLAVLDHPVSPVDAEVRGPMEGTIETLERKGVAIERESDLLPDLARQHADYMRMLAIVMARGAPGPDGKRATAADWFELLDVQAASEAAWERLFERYDYILAPPAPVLAIPHDPRPVRERTVTIDGTERPFAEVFDWAGLVTFPNLPATVLPIGASGELPCGMQVVGPRWGDLGCIAAARAIGEALCDDG